MTKSIHSVERFPHLLVFPEWSSSGLFAHWKYPEPGLTCIDLDGLPDWLADRLRYMMSWMEQSFDAIVFNNRFFDETAFNAYVLSLRFDLKRVLGDKGVVYGTCERGSTELQPVVQAAALSGREASGSPPPLGNGLTHFYVALAQGGSALWGNKDDSPYQVYSYEGLPPWLADRLRYVLTWRLNEQQALLFQNGAFDHEGFEAYRLSVAVDLKRFLGCAAVVWRNTDGPLDQWVPLEVAPFLPAECGR